MTTKYTKHTKAGGETPQSLFENSNLDCSSRRKEAQVSRFLRAFMVKSHPDRSGLTSAATFQTDSQGTPPQNAHGGVKGLCNPFPFRVLSCVSWFQLLFPGGIVPPDRFPPSGTAIGLAVFRQRITAVTAQAVWADVEADLQSGALTFIPLVWPAVFREAEAMAQRHTPGLGSRSLDILHVAAVLAASAVDFVTFDNRQAALAKEAGLNVKA